MSFPNPDRHPTVTTDIGHGIVIRTSDPDLGRKVMAILGALSAAPVVAPKLLSGPERRALDLEAFGLAYVQIVEHQMPKYYQGDRASLTLPARAPVAGRRAA